MDRWFVFVVSTAPHFALLRPFKLALSSKSYTSIMPHAGRRRRHGRPPPHPSKTPALSPPVFPHVFPFRSARGWLPGPASGSSCTPPSSPTPPPRSPSRSSPPSPVNAVMVGGCVFALHTSEGGAHHYNGQCHPTSPPTHLLERGERQRLGLLQREGVAVALLQVRLGALRPGAFTSATAIISCGGRVEP